MPWRSSPTLEARHEGDRAIAVSWSRYTRTPLKSKVRDIYDNAYLLEFGPGGRCRSFTEFFVQRPKDRV